MIKINIIITILVFGLLIIIHEVGHFATAKARGVDVQEFWLGMGPSIFEKEFKGTIYKLKLLPFGGAVVMEEDSSESSSSFFNASPLSKALILFAGAFMNFVLGFVILFFISTTIDAIYTPTIDSFADGFAYSGQNGFQVGDTFLQINEFEIKTNGELISAINSSEDYIFDIKMLRDGEIINIDNFEFKPDTFIENGEEVYRFGLNFTQEKPPATFVFTNAFNMTISHAKMVWGGLFEIFSGNVGIDEMSGPIGITSMIGESLSYSYTTMWNFVAFISINLGIANLLPIPALDGGRLVFVAIEAIIKKPVNPKIEGYIHGVGLIVLLTLMCCITFHDIFVKTWS